MELISEWSTPLPTKDSNVRTWSPEDFFARVKTYKITTWLDKPLPLSPLDCARYGWINVGKDLLECGNCKARAMFKSHQDLERATVRTMANEFKKQLENEKHKDGCAWKNNPSLPFGQLSDDAYVIFNSYQTRTQQLYDNAKKFPVIAPSFLISLLDSFGDLNGTSLLQKSKLTPPTTKAIVSCILAICGWEWKQPSPNSSSNSDSPPRTPSSPSASPIASPSSNHRSSLASPKSPVAPPPQNDYISCTFCQREIGLWNHIYHQDLNGMDADYLMLFKERQLVHKSATTRIDYQSFGKTWNKPPTTFLQPAGWGWGSSITKIGHQDKHKTIQKEPFNPVEAHRWFCPYLLSAGGQGGENKDEVGWQRVARAIKEIPLEPPMEEQALHVMNLLHDLTSPIPKRRRIDA